MSAKPIHTLRIGSVKVSVWENHGEKGVFHTTTIARQFKDGSDQ